MSLKKLPRFIFFDTPTLPGAGFVLNLEQPFYIAKVWKFYSSEKLETFIQEKKISDSNFTFVSGYLIMLTYFGNLMEQNNPLKSDVKEALKQMAEYYLKEKIHLHVAAYTKYRE